MQAANVSVYSGSWRYPSAAEDYLDLRYYQRIARVLEEGTFDLMFFDDRLAMPSIYGGAPPRAPPPARCEHRAVGGVREGGPFDFVFFRRPPRDAVDLRRVARRGRPLRRP